MLLVRIVVLVMAAVLWVSGLRLFLRSELAVRRKIVWSLLLIGVGIAIGLFLPIAQIWRKFLLLLILLPILAVVDVWLMRSSRGLSFWVRACGFEVGTVFGVATATRLLLEW